MFSDPKFVDIDPEKLYLENKGNCLSNFEFDVTDVTKAIDELTDTSVAGPDGIAAYFLKQCKFTLSIPLYLLYRESLDDAVINNMGKISSIIPLHKGGNFGFPVNYRPV